MRPKNKHHPLPDIPKYRKKKTPKPKPYKIEGCFFASPALKQKWYNQGSYETEAKRDQALEQLKKSHGNYMSFRKKDDK